MAEEVGGGTWGERFVLRAASRIREARRSQGYSVRELAERTAQLGHEVTRQVLVNLEAGRRRTLSVDDLFVIAHALAVNPLFLLFDQLQMGRPNEVLPGLQVPEWMALQWARSFSTQISTALYEEDFNEARGIISARQRIDSLRMEIATLERQIAMHVERDEEAAADATRAAVEAHQKHEKTLVDMLAMDGVQMNDAWFRDEILQQYLKHVWDPDRGEIDG